MTASRMSVKNKRNGSTFARYFSLVFQVQWEGKCNTQTRIKKLHILIDDERGACIRKFNEYWAVKQNASMKNANSDCFEQAPSSRRT